MCNIHAVIRDETVRLQHHKRACIAHMLLIVENKRKCAINATRQDTKDDKHGYLLRQPRTSNGIGGKEATASTINILHGRVGCFCCCVLGVLERTANEGQPRLRVVPGFTNASSFTIPFRVPAFWATLIHSLVSLNTQTETYSEAYLPENIWVPRQSIHQLSQPLALVLVLTRVAFVRTGITVKTGPVGKSTSGGSKNQLWRGLSSNDMAARRALMPHVPHRPHRLRVGHALVEVA